MKLTRVIIFEGTDGSGKSTLIKGLSSYFRKNNITFFVITKELNILTKKISTLIQDSNLNCISEIFLRLAREFIKIEKIVKDEYDYYLLDRGILSIITMIKVNNLKISLFEHALKDLNAKLKNNGTVLCHPSFEISRNRTINRQKECGKELTKKELKGYDYNKKIYTIFSEEFSSSEFINNKLLLDTNTLSVEESIEKIIEFSNTLPKN